MKFLLLFLIKLYWFFIPKSKRRQCIFRKSCSNYIYEETSKKGLISGLKALRFRYQNCRSSYILINDPLSDEKLMLLPNQQIIEEKEIDIRLIHKN
ncbi:membrane protein insertion efficiency factor YidD [Aquimarina sp. MMG016]|uniref:membrane protein insertion efficiency factor YidD n=1 Tax=Aquimarina sp. MMG016 TaxID=2822690 RepID=UPI001B3A762D|nr:membrane protein insertion efficiency factor YidD [Aquimarina sp. MMG016]MBQ4819611.1 membrane protein insertion efficiency factor YidD [Aquimarina sp. MMG016]